MQLYLKPGQLFTDFFCNLTVCRKEFRRFQYELNNIFDVLLFFLIFLSLSLILSMLLALNPRGRASSTIFPYSHGTQQASHLPPSASQKVFTWTFGDLWSSPCAESHQGHQEEGQGQLIPHELYLCYISYVSL